MSEFVCDVMLEDLFLAAHHRRAPPCLSVIPRIDSPAFGLRVVAHSSIKAKGGGLGLLMTVVRQLVWAGVIDKTTPCARMDMTVQPDLVAFGMVRIIVLPAGGSVVEP